MPSCILAKPRKSHAEDTVTLSRKELIRGLAKSSRAVAMRPPSVSRLVENGEKILDNQKHVAVKMTDMAL